MGKFLRNVFNRKYIALLLVLALAFQIVAPGFAHAASGPAITINSGTSYSTGNVNLSFSVSSTVQVKDTSASITVDGKSIAAGFTYSGYWVKDSCPDCEDGYYQVTSYTSGTISGNVPNLHDGSHTVRVTIADVNGYSTTNEWTINVNQIPTLTSPSPVNAAETADKTGFSVKFNDNDSIDQSSLVATLDNVNVPVVFDSSTNLISYKPGTGIADGYHSVKVNVKDSSGNQATLSWNFTISTSGPQLTFANAGQTFNSMPSLTVSLSSIVKLSDNINNYIVTIDGQRVNANFDYKGHWVYGTCPDCEDDWIIDSYKEGSLTPSTSSMSDGTHTIQVTAKDSLGNSTTNQWTFNMLTKPSLNQPSPANGVVTVDNSGFFVKVTPNGGTVNESSISATLDNVQVPINYNSSTGIVSYKPSTPIPDGTHSVKVTVSNTNGYSSDITWSYSIKSVGPSQTFIGSDQTFESIPYITVNLSSDVRISDSGYTVKIDGQPVNANFDYKGHWEYGTCPDCEDYWVIDSYNEGSLTFYPHSLTDGKHILSVSAKDYLGNTTIEQWSFTTKTNTFVTFTSPENNYTTSGNLSITGNTNLDKMNLTATKYGTNNVINIGDKTGANATWNWDTTKVSEGEYILTLTGYDSVGNTVTSKINVKVQNVPQGMGLDHTGTVDNHVGKVNVTNGNFVVKLPGRGFGTDFSRVYNGQMKTNGVLGWGWRIDVPELSQYSDGSVIIMDGNGAKHTYSVNTDGSYTGPKGDYDILTKNTDGTFTLKSKDGSKYVFDLVHNKVSQIDKNNNTVVYQYDMNNRLMSITDSTNRVTNLSYDSTTGRLTSVKDYASSTWSYSYDMNGNLIKVTDPLQHSQTFAYDSNHQLISVTDANGKTTIFSYTGNQLTGVTDPAPLSYNTTYSYDGNNKQFVDTDAKGNTTKYIYDASGNVKTVTDALNNTNSYTYDTNYNVLTKTDVLGNVTSFTYDSMGNGLTITDPMNHTTTYTYDSNNNMLTQMNALGTVTNYAYDAKGNQISDGTNMYTYNADGSVSTVKDAKGNVTTYSYDMNGNVSSVTDALNNQTQFTYDAAGNKVKETDASGNTTTYTYDTLGHMLSVTAGGKTTSYTYDVNGNRLTSTDANGNVSSWTYDALNRVIAETEPGNKVKSTTYDANGNILSKTAADGTVTNYNYDQLNRQTEAKNPNGSVVSYQYDAVGNRVIMIESTGTTTYQYDKDGNLTKQTDPTGKVTTYSYNANNQQTGKVVDGKSFTYNYDSQGNLKSMVDSNNLITSFSYDANKNRTAINYASGSKINYSYDAGNEVIDVNNLGPTGNVIANFHYTYDNSQVQTVTDSKGVTSYVYDGQNRLIKITGPTREVTEYTYDDIGNRASESKTVNGVNSTISYTYDPSTNVLTKVTNADGSTITYNYDSNGNTLTKIDSAGTTKYDYNSNNQLTKVTKSNGDVITYAYNGDNQRISKTVNGVVTNYVYDGNEVSKETDASGNILASYVYNEKGSPVSVTKGGKVYNFQYNGHGDVVALTDSAGNVVSTYAYDVWGNVTAKTGNVDSLYGYVGMFGYVYDQETGFYFLKSRYYDPTIGRFTTKDRFNGFEDDPQSLNSYSYTENNPIMNIDPEGTFSIRSDILAQAIDLALMAIPVLGELNKYIGALGKVQAAYKLNSVKIIPTIEVEAAKVTSRLGAKVRIAGLLGGLLNQALGIITGFSIGKGVAWVLGRIYGTRTAKEKQYIWWGPQISVTYITF